MLILLWLFVCNQMRRNTRFNVRIIWCCLQRLKLSLWLVEWPVIHLLLIPSRSSLDPPALSEEEGTIFWAYKMAPPLLLLDLFPLFFCGEYMCSDWYQIVCGRSAKSISDGIICLHPFLNHLLLLISGLLPGDIKSSSWNLHLAGCAALLLQFNCFYCRLQLSFTHMDSQSYTGDKKTHKWPMQHSSLTIW